MHSIKLASVGLNLGGGITHGANKLPEFVVKVLLQFFSLFQIQ